MEQVHVLQSTTFCLRLQSRKLYHERYWYPKGTILISLTRVSAEAHCCTTGLPPLCWCSLSLRWDHFQPNESPWLRQVTVMRLRTTRLQDMHLKARETVFMSMQRIYLMYCLSMPNSYLVWCRLFKSSNANLKTHFLWLKINVRRAVTGPSCFRNNTAAHQELHAILLSLSSS